MTGALGLHANAQQLTPIEVEPGVGLEPSAAQAESVESHTRVLDRKLYALDLIGPSWLSGPGFQVESEIAWRGSFAVFDVRSDYGPLEVTSAELLAIRIEEFAAIAELNRISRMKAFRDSAGDALARTGRALKKVLGSPVETVKRLPDAIKEKAKDTYDSAREGAKNLADRAREEMRNDDGDPVRANPFLPPEPPKVELTDSEREAERVEQAKAVAKDLSLDYFGYGSAKRRLMHRLDVDPYTRNPLIHARLDELTWAAMAGSKGVGFTVGLVTGGASVVVSRAGRLNRLVWELPEEDLRKRNRDELKRAGMKGPRARAFLRNRGFTASIQTQYVDALLKLAQVQGVYNLLDIAASARDEVDARYFLRSVELAQAHHPSYSRARALHRQMVFELGRKGIVVPVSADYLRSDPATRNFFELEEFRNTENTLLVAGRVQNKLRQELEAKGWRIVELDMGTGTHGE
jgi:hypothetical protein